MRPKVGRTMVGLAEAARIVPHNVAVVMPREEENGSRHFAR
jgi:hypothetical protein